jgi:hypothetical protein
LLYPKAERERRAGLTFPELPKENRVCPAGSRMQGRLLSTGWFFPKESLLVSSNLSYDNRSAGALRPPEGV